MKNSYSMTASSIADTSADARRWVPILARYREPSTSRSLFEVAITLAAFVLLWALGWWALSISPWLAGGIAVLNAFILVRLFVIQHDCGHGALFSSRRLADWTGRALGVLTVTPYDVWRRIHAEHHGHSGNLDRRGMGEVQTLTAAEYRALSPMGQLRYRIYRHPAFLFGFAPAWVFLLENRLPLGLMRAGRVYWISAMGTNVAVAALLGLIWYFGGLLPLLVLFLPTTVLAATIGVWLFYVQHQFEETHFEHEPEWQLHDAALHGSSHYDLPAPLHWLTANIGLHHVHHLNSRIPFYRLPAVLRDHPELDRAGQRLTLRESLHCVRLKLWDEERRKLVTLADGLAPAAA
ncbi:Fatty acid desaturase [Jannaschia seosinensis]|uniref:Fatty acid desaturase n=1 Tax=Jannaschia seosinensis TaxID=313367 RepID=A0A0M7BGI7_9RHOB|nr:fatty acid desaturase [Jannaschia seosinensis]CUH40505.1 Fatty acid desaturase [Jannaschia seosinensis]